MTIALIQPTVRRRASHPERAIHLDVLAYLRLVLPGAATHSSPNSFGDMSGPNVGRQVAKARHMGMTPGWPDIECFYQGRAMFFEVKAEGGRMSDHQRLVSQSLTDNGALWAVVRSIADVREYLAAWGIQTREVQP